MELCNFVISKARDNAISTPSCNRVQNDHIACILNRHDNIGRLMNCWGNHLRYWIVDRCWVAYVLWMKGHWCQIEIWYHLAWQSLSTNVGIGARYELIWLVLRIQGQFQSAPCIQHSPWLEQHGRVSWGQHQGWQCIPILTWRIL